MKPARLVPLLVAAGTVVSALAVASPQAAQAASRVTVTNSQGSAKADTKYATTLTLRGSGFQSIQKGYGGIYVLFGTVKGTWQPSKGGTTGRSILYVPDSQTKNNSGFEKFVSFPGGDTESSANGGTISASGTWSTTIVVPGSTFRTVTAAGKAVTVDCLKVTCGVITIGAHGVANSRNETFTPISFGTLQTSGTTASTTTTAPSASSTAASTTTEAPKVAAKAALTVDRTTAVAGHAMTFTAVGLTPGDQVVASFDDGAAAVGPLSVGPNGQVAGTVLLPKDTGPGTHTLRISGTSRSPSTSFAVQSATSDSDVVPAAAEPAGTPRPAVVFAGVAAAALLGSWVFAAMRLRSRRRAVTGA